MSFVTDPYETIEAAFSRGVTEDWKSSVTVAFAELLCQGERGDLAQIPLLSSDTPPNTLARFVGLVTDSEHVECLH